MEDTVLLMPEGISLLAWGASVLVFGKALQFLTEFLKLRLEHQFGHLPNYAIHIINFALGLGVAYYLHSAGFLTDATFAAYSPPFNWIAFSVMASAIAAGWYDLLKNPQVPTSAVAAPTTDRLSPPRFK